MATHSVRLPVKTRRDLLGILGLSAAIMAAPAAATAVAFMTLSATVGWLCPSDAGLVGAACQVASPLVGATAASFGTLAALFTVVLVVFATVGITASRFGWAATGGEPANAAERTEPVPAEPAHRAVETDGQHPEKEQEETPDSLVDRVDGDEAAPLFRVGDRVRMARDLGEFDAGEIVTVTRVLTGPRLYDYFVENHAGIDRLVFADEITGL